MLQTHTGFPLTPRGYNVISDSWIEVTVKAGKIYMVRFIRPGQRYQQKMADRLNRSAIWRHIPAIKDCYVFMKRRYYLRESCKNSRKYLSLP